jgi:hypothetical protein
MGVITHDVGVSRKPMVSVVRQIAKRVRYLPGVGNWHGLWDAIRSPYQRFLRVRGRVEIIESSAFLGHPGANPRDWQRIQKNSLLHNAQNVYSQRGDDGVIGEIFRRLHIAKGFFVEFGAWDGIYLSNTRWLFEQGWSGAYIEADPIKFAELKRNYAAFPHILCIQERVGLPGGDGKLIDQIAADNFLDRKIDLMIIDIDGLDYCVLETMTLRPTVVFIEGGFAWHPTFTQRVPDAVASKNLQQPLAVMIQIGLAAGYTPVCFNQNVYLVLNKLAHVFDAIRNDALTLWYDAWFNETDAFRRALQKNRRSNTFVRDQEGPEFEELPP